MQSQCAKLNFLKAKFNASTFHALYIRTIAIEAFYPKDKNNEEKINSSYLFILSCQTGGKYLNEISVNRLNLMRRTNLIQIVRSQKFLMNVRA